MKLSAPATCSQVQGYKELPEKRLAEKMGEIGFKTKLQLPVPMCVVIRTGQQEREKDRKRNSDNSGQMTPISSLFFSCPCSKRCIIAANYYYCRASAIRDAGERGNLCTMARQSNGSAEQISLLGHRLEAAQVSSTPPATLTGDWH